MKMWKRSCLLVLAMIMVISLIGCAPKENLDKDEGLTSTESQGENENKPEEVEDQPIIIKDHLGREVEITEEPERIVSGYFITTSMMIPLGLKDKVVGIEAKAKSRNIYNLAAPEFIDLPNVGTAKEFDLEGCIALNPDLVILPIRLKEVVESLEGLGIKVIAVNPEDMELLKETLSMIGLATGTSDKAEELISYYEDKTEEVVKRAQGKEETKVYLGGNSDFLSTAPKAMYQHYLIETAGGVNVASDIEDNYWANISYEQLIAYNPDLVVIVPSATYSKDDVLNDNKLSSINAIKNGKVYEMPDAFEAWDSPIPSSILGTMWLSSILYEDDYSFDEFKENVVAFYSQFYNIDINKEDIKR